MNLTLILVVFLLIWSSGLTAFLIWLFTRIRILIKGTEDKDFLKVFKNILSLQEKNQQDILNLNLELDRYKKDSMVNISHVGLYKYNPFNESGGDHSFSLALLDSHKNGIIITSLHTRERTRLYVKEVSLGKPKLELSKDEEKALKLSFK